MQLVAYGAQDVYLTGNAQITFFKTVYRRHTNFAMEMIDQVFTGGRADFGQKVSCTVARNGDLMHRVFLRATLPRVTVSAAEDGADAQARWVEEVGHALIKCVTLEIGGQTIDKQYGEWLCIYNELTLPAGKRAGYDAMIGNVPELTELKRVPVAVGSEGGCCDDGATCTPDDGSCAPAYTVYVPLQFYFCRNAGLALPLIALQYHEVKLQVELTELKKLLWSNAPSVRARAAAAGLLDAALMVEYVYLDTYERRRMAQASHEYLIEQVQFSGADSTGAVAKRVALSLNHPVKELVWVAQRADYTGCDGGSEAAAHGGPQPFNFSDAWVQDVEDGGRGGVNPVARAKLQLNGHDRFAEADGAFFSLVQPYMHHTNVPARRRGINVYSFALKPEEHQPSGSCNFSRLDSAVLVLQLTPRAVAGTEVLIRVYAVTYNVLRCMEGMAGLAYSN